MKKIILAVAALLLIGVCATVCIKRESQVGSLTTIDGIPYPLEDGRTVVTERLAHADMYVHGPLVGKQLLLTVTFIPLNATELRVGIRENSFWLSYPWQILYRREAPEANGPVYESLTRTVIIPLTDKLPDRDGSLDLMFIQGSEAVPLENPAVDTTFWQSERISGTVSPALPSVPEAKDYVRRLITHEVPL